MASLSKTLMLFSFTIFASLQCLPVSSSEYDVGDADGWTVPPANDSKIYNDWASGNRFRIGDIIRFRYRKDSVMEVEERGYKNCNSTRPKFFSNTGNTAIKLDRAGALYFISGVSGHCERGQKMIVQVMAPEHSSSRDATVPSSGSTTVPLTPSFGPASLIVLAHLCLSFLVPNLFY